MLNLDIEKLPHGYRRREHDQLGEGVDVTKPTRELTPEEAEAKRAANKAYQAAWYLANRERLLEKQRQYKINNREAVLATKRAWRVANPEADKAAKQASYAKNADYYKQKQRAYYAANRERLGLIQKEWAAENRELVALVKSRYKHRRRELEAQNGIFLVTKRDARRLMDASGNACVYCRLPFTATRPMTWDHIIPVTRGGVFSVGNLAPACGPCNSSKLNKTVTEWRAYQRRTGAAA